MDGYVRQRETGIVQNDFAGRNIILVPNENPAAERKYGLILPVPRVVLVDYNKANMQRVSSDEVDSRPSNPALDFWRNYLISLGRHCRLGWYHYQIRGARLRSSNSGCYGDFAGMVKKNCTVLFQSGWTG